MLAPLASDRSWTRNREVDNQCQRAERRPILQVEAGYVSARTTTTARSLIYRTVTATTNNIDWLIISVKIIILASSCFLWMRHDHSIKNAYWLPISAPFYWITATYRPLLCLFTAMYAPLDCHCHFYTISTATSGPIVWLTCGMFAGEMEMGGGLFSLVLQCIHNHIRLIRVMIWRTLYLLTCLTFGVDLETISTYLCHNCGPVFTIIFQY